MTEAEWIHCDNPESILTIQAIKGGDRKQILFGCACQYRFLHLRLNEEISLRDTVSDLERFADGLIDRNDLHLSWREAKPLDIAVLLARDAALSSARMGLVDGKKEQGAQADLLRDIFGNPFRPVTINPKWLTPNALTLAQMIYDERSFDRMPALADALSANC